MRFTLRICAILVASVLAAVGWTAHRGLSWRVDRARVEAVQQHKSWFAEHAPIDLDTLRSQLAEGLTVVIDARRSEKFEQAHLDAQALGAPIGCLNVPPGTLIENLGRLMPLVDLGFSFILYCNSATCDLAEELAAEMAEQGIDRSRIRIYVPGWAGIERSALPTTSGPDTFDPAELQASSPAPVTEPAAEPPSADGPP